MDNIKAYYEALNYIKASHKYEGEIEEEFDNKCHKIKWAYRDKIHALENTRDRKINVMTNTKDAVLKQLQKKKEPYNALLKTAETFFNYMDVYVGPIRIFLTPDKKLPLLLHDLEEDEKDEYNRRLRNEPRVLEPLVVYTYSDYDNSGSYIGRNANKKVLPPIEMLADDNMKRVGLFIMPNKKPLNKYSLTLAFRYSLPTNIIKTSPGRQDWITLKDFPTEKALMAYYGKARAKLIETYVTPYIAAEKEYTEAIETFKDPAWRLAYMLHKKHYYEKHYSHGTDTKEYKAILKETQALRKAP